MASKEWVYKMANNSGEGQTWFDDRHLELGGCDSYAKQLGGLSDLRLRLARPGAIVVDAGAGTTRAASQLQNEYPDSAVFAINLVPDPRHATFLGSHSNRVIIADLMNMGELFQANTLTGILAVRSVTYTPREQITPWIESVSKLLAPGGILKIAGDSIASANPYELSVGELIEPIKNCGLRLTEWDAGVSGSYGNSWLVAVK